MSGYELINRIYGIDKKSRQKIKYHQTKEFWLGYYLAYFQWYTCSRFKDIFFCLNYEHLINLYPVFHGTDVMKFVEEITHKLSSIKVNRIKYYRAKNHLSQNQLAIKSGVNKHMIQLYEQGVNDLNKAQVNTLCRLAKALHCEIEDLLVNPLIK